MHCFSVENFQTLNMPDIMTITPTYALKKGKQVNDTKHNSSSQDGVAFYLYAVVEAHSCIKVNVILRYHLKILK